MRNILILQLNRLGDLVQTLPLLRRLRREHPEARIVLAALEGFSGVLAECDCFDTLIALSQRDVDALADPAARDAFPDSPPYDAHPEFRRSFDLLVNVTSDLGSAVLCEKVKAERKLGRIHTYEGELRLLGPWAKYMFSLVGHRTGNLFNIVDVQMGIAGLTPAPEPESLPVTEARLREAEAMLAAHGRKPGRRLIALQASASDLHRAWSLENFTALARMLMSDGYADIVLLGSGGERDRTARLAEAIGLPVLDLAGKTSLVQLPAVLKSCDLLISNDTGTIHVAAAAGTRALGLYFSTAYYSETAPYGSDHVVLQVEIPCSPCNTSTRCPVQICRESLPPEAVDETARWMLGSRPELPAARTGLSAYRSRFLSNGSLAYLPLRPESLSAQFLSGLLGRLLWEGALGLDPDPELEGLRRRAAGLPEWGSRIRAVAKGLSELAPPFRDGLDLAEKLRAEFRSAAPVRERILMLHEQLAGLGRIMAEASRSAGLHGSFLQFEMMDMDFSAYPALADLLAEKYRDLCAWADRFEAVLARLSRS